MDHTVSGQYRKTEGARVQEAEGLEGRWGVWSLFSKAVGRQAGE